MCADDIVYEFPFAPAAGVHRLDGKAAPTAYLSKVGQLISLESATETAVHRTGDPEVTIVEFGVTGSDVRTGVAYNQRYVAVIRTRGGSIVHYRDYRNPLLLLAAAGGERAMRDVLTGADA